MLTSLGTASFENLIGEAAVDPSTEEKGALGAPRDVLAPRADSDFGRDEVRRTGMKDEVERGGLGREAGRHCRFNG